MKKITWTGLVLSVIISGIIFNLGNSLQIFEEQNQNYPLSLSNSDSWSKNVNEGENIYSTHCELINGSLYIIGRLESDDLYVSKFYTSGEKEWEFSLELNSDNRFSYVFDDENNLLILIDFYYSNIFSIIKLNSEGTLLFSKQISLELYDISCVLSENNSLLVVGASKDPRKLVIMKFNGVGEFLWNTSFDIDYYYRHSYIVKDSGYNIYLDFRKNSVWTIAKINASGTKLWQISIDYPFPRFITDTNDNLYVMGGKNYTATFILKLNSTGDQIKELLIDNFGYDDGYIWYLNDLLVFNRRTLLILCYDLNLDQKWNFSLTDYITYPFFLQTFIAKDSHGNVYVIQNNALENINLVKISSSGEFLSRIIWGGYFDEKPGSLIIDSLNNIYFICICEYSNFWGDWVRSAVLVKNPVHGGVPPEPIRDLDERDFFIFSVLGITCIISPIALRSILKSNKKRTG